MSCRQNIMRNDVKPENLRTDRKKFNYLNLLAIALLLLMVCLLFSIAISLKKDGGECVKDPLVYIKNKYPGINCYCVDASQFEDMGIEIFEEN